MGSVKYMPMIVAATTVILVVLAFEPLFEIFYYIFHLPAQLAIALDLLLISVCVMFLIGLGSNKKQFLVAAGLMGFSIFLILLVFV